MDFFTAFTFGVWTVLGQSVLFGILLAIGVRIALEVLAPANASTRFAVWFATLIIVAAFPLAAFLHWTAPELAQRAAAEVHETTPPMASPARESLVSQPAAAPIAPRVDPVPPRSVKNRVEHPLQTIVLLPSDVAGVFLGLYAFVVFLLFGRLAVSYLRLRRLKRNAFPAPAEVRTRFESWRSQCKTSRPVRLLLTGKARSPMAVGFNSPAVIIPEALLLRLTCKELDHLGLHELAHMRRGDDWTNLAQRVIQALFFFNPAVLWICRRLDFEREVACDDWVLTITGEAKPYARSLTKVLEATPWRRGPVLASGAVFRKQQIIRRIEMLLDGSRDSRPNVSHVTLVVILMCILGAFSQLVRTPAFVAFGDDPSGSFHRSRWSVDGRTIETEIRGEIRFADDDISVETMSPGGYLRVKENRGWSRRELEIRDDSTQPKIRYAVDGRERPLDEQGKAWMNTVVPMIIRESGIDAEDRAARILKKRGAAGVFEERDDPLRGLVDPRLAHRVLDGARERTGARARGRAPLGTRTARGQAHDQAHGQRGDQSHRDRTQPPAPRVFRPCPLHTGPSC
jgi:beta-lactamase regulating signal transducer with metallopeptidase domain